MHHYHPKGRQLPALERNILKFRAFEMVLLVFHVEELKNFALESVHSIHLSRAYQAKPRPAEVTKKPLLGAWAALVDSGILTEADRDGIRRLIDYRNIIAHNLHQLTSDISRDELAEDYAKFLNVKYDYTALSRVKQYRRKITDGMAARHILPLSFEDVIFEAAEKTYELELRRLKRTINRQIEARRHFMRDVNSEISAAEHMLRELQPHHPLNVGRNGQLTPRGLRVCYRLFCYGLSTFAVSHLMRISYRAIAARRCQWERAGQPAVETDAAR